MTDEEYAEMMYESRKADGIECVSCHEDHGPSDPLGFYYDEWLHESCFSGNDETDYYYNIVRGYE